MVYIESAIAFYHLLRARLICGAAYTLLNSESSLLTHTHTHTYTGLDSLLAFLTRLSLGDDNEPITEQLVCAQCFSLLFSRLTTCTFPLLSPLPLPLKPNYPQRTQRSYHKARSYFTAHHAPEPTGLQNSKHSYPRRSTGPCMEQLFGFTQKVSYE